MERALLCLQCFAHYIRNRLHRAHALVKARGDGTCAAMLCSASRARPPVRSGVGKYTARCGHCQPIRRIEQWSEPSFSCSSSCSSCSCSSCSSCSSSQWSGSVGLTMTYPAEPIAIPVARSCSERRPGPMTSRSQWAVGLVVHDVTEGVKIQVAHVMSASIHAVTPSEWVSMHAHIMMTMERDRPT